MGIEIKICDECEACWAQNQIIGLEKFKGLVPFLEENGLTYKDSKIEKLNYTAEIKIAYPVKL